MARPEQSERGERPAPNQRRMVMKHTALALALSLTATTAFADGHLPPPTASPLPPIEQIDLGICAGVFGGAALLSAPVAGMGGVMAGVICLIALNDVVFHLEGGRHDE